MLKKPIYLMFLALAVLILGCSGSDNPSSRNNNQIGNYIPPDEGDDEEPPPDDPNEIKTRWDAPGGASEIPHWLFGTRLHSIA